MYSAAPNRTPRADAPATNLDLQQLLELLNTLINIVSTPNSHTDKDFLDMYERLEALVNHRLAARERELRRRDHPHAVRHVDEQKQLRKTLVDLYNSYFFRDQMECESCAVSLTKHLLVHLQGSEMRPSRPA